MHDDTSSSPPRGAGRAPTGDDPEPVSADTPPSQAFRDALGQFAELKEYLRYYVDAKVDAYKVTTRNIAIYAVLGVIGAAGGVAVVMTAIVLLMYGISDGIGSLCAWAFNSPGWWWIGPFLVGLFIIGGMVGGVVFGMKWLTRTTHRRLVEKYEDRQNRQRASFGHDVEDRAGAQHAGR